VRRPATDDPYPLSLWGTFRLIANHRERVLKRVDTVPTKLEVVIPATTNRVGMRIIEARNHRAIAGIDHAGVLATYALHRRVIASRDELAVAYRKRTCSWLLRINCHNRG